MEILGVDIGGSGIKGAIVDTVTGELKSERIRIETPQPATPDAVAKTLKQLVEQIGYKGLVGCGFPARVINGEVLTAANIDKPWINVKVEELFTKTSGMDVDVRDFVPYEIHANDMPFKHFAKVASSLGLEVTPMKSKGGSDANSLNAKGIKTINLGVGAQNPHGNDEFILYKDFMNAAEIAYQLLTTHLD